MSELARDLEVVFDEMIKGTHFVGVRNAKIENKTYTYDLDLLGIQPGLVIKELREFLVHICKYNVKRIEIIGSSAQRNLRLLIDLG